MHTSGTTTARAYSALVHHTLGAMVAGLPQGEAASITLRAGLVVEAKIDAKWTTRYTVRRDGVASRGISALVIALEAHWEAEHAQADAQDRADAGQAPAPRALCTASQWERLNTPAGDNFDDVRKPQAPASTASAMSGWHRLG